MKSFAALFKKYRLRAEFDTFSAFSEALAQKGYFYDESIFSHWQKGTRVPSNRELLLVLITLFVELDSMHSVKEANEFLDSARQGYLTESEKESIPFKELDDAPFQVPSEIAHFTGRENIVKLFSKKLVNTNVFFLHGPPGVGKTALAIRLGHLLRDKFSDGVLWYKVDSSNIMDILLSIAHLYGEDISEIKDIEVRASIVRTLLAKKKTLLIFDNVSKQDKLHLLLPNSTTCRIIFSSRENIFGDAAKSIAIPIQIFTEEEVLLLFNKVFDRGYVEKQEKIIIEVAQKLGNLPLALHLVATHSKQFGTPLKNYLTQLDEEQFDLESLTYEDKNLFRAIDISFNSLEKTSKKVFVSLGIFEGKDFSIEAVSYINKLSLQETEKNILQLLSISLVEQSKKGRYRIHPMIRAFARKRIENSTLYLRAATYYERQLTNAQDKYSQKQLMQDVDNIIAIFKKCYEAGFWDQVITLWNPIEKFLSDIKDVKKLGSLTQTIDTAPSVNAMQKVLTGYLIFMLVFWFLLFIGELKTSIWNYHYSSLITFLPLTGGVFGILRAKYWGLFKSNIGKAIFFTSLGSMSWGIGNIIWAYYNYNLNIELPYPSFADLGFFPAPLFWITGVIYLTKATGAKFKIKNRINKLVLLIPLVIISLSYYFLFFIVERSYISETPLNVFFDLYYPSIDIVLLTLALIIFGLSVNFFGGKYKRSLFSMLAGFIVLYISDFAFSYVTSIDAYHNGGTTDLSFTIGFYLLSWGTLSFYFTPKKKKILF